MESTAIPARYVEGAYAAENPDWPAVDAPFKADAVFRMVERNCLRPHSIADIGCGTGAVLEIRAEQFLSGTELAGYEGAKSR
jgi:hypothetical protein